MSEILTDADFMRRALELAQRAQAEGEVPVGAVVVHEGRIVGEGWNHPISSADATSHAETEAIRAACKALNNYRIPGSTLYVTLEPCVMCAGASYWFQLSKIVFGAYDTQRGFGRISQKIVHPKTVVTGGIFENECSELIKEFFKKKR